MFFEAHNLSLLMGRAQVMLFLFLGQLRTEIKEALLVFSPRGRCRSRELYVF
jgi:hypothetical protein